MISMVLKIIINALVCQGVFAKITID
jgi:hypothetical protein